MKLFRCAACGHALYFENVRCERCGHALGFFPEWLDLGPVETRGGATLEPIGSRGGRWRRCGHADVLGCNWLVRAEDESHWCLACALNRTIPDLSIPCNVERWQILERAKRRLVYGLLRLGLIVEARDRAVGGLAFEFLGDGADGTPVMTGHADGVVTVNVAEADPVEGVRRREQLDEPYRTVLGHLRHEIAHYYWPRLVRGEPELQSFRAAFGDERTDYSRSMQRYYALGARPDWQAGHISAYAAAHPWEDWAETFAHYLHIVDALETARSFGIRIDPDVAAAPGVDTDRLGDPYRAVSAAALVGAWLPLTFAVNSLNRSMGLGDLYPFVLAAPVVGKLETVHRLIRDGRSAAP